MSKCPQSETADRFCWFLPGFLKMKCQTQWSASAGTFPMLCSREGLPQCVPNLLFIEIALSWLCNSQFLFFSLAPIIWHLTRENVVDSRCLPLQPRQQPQNRLFIVTELLFLSFWPHKLSLANTAISYREYIYLSFFDVKTQSMSHSLRTSDTEIFRFHEERRWEPFIIPSQSLVLALKEKSRQKQECKMHGLINSHLKKCLYFQVQSSIICRLNEISKNAPISPVLI